MKALFTIHAGEFLVGCEIERRFRNLNVWIPARDTGIDLLVSNRDNTSTVSLQVKYSRDYVSTHIRDTYVNNLRACGWWTPTRRQIAESPAQYWVFVLFGIENRNTDYIIIRPDELLRRFSSIHGTETSRYQSYLWVTRRGKCFETRGLNNEDRGLVADGRFKHNIRDFTACLNNWAPIEKVND